MNKEKSKKNQNHFTIVFHRRAKLDYEILETIEAGLVLKGSEVKSLRDKKCQLKDSYVIFQHSEPYLQHLHINPYPPAADRNHSPQRRRKLLLHRNESHRLSSQMNQKGLSCIPLKLYFKNGKVKAQLAVVKGRKKGDKREYIKKKEMEKTARRAMRRYR